MRFATTIRRCNMNKTKSILLFALIALAIVTLIYVWPTRSKRLKDYGNSIISKIETFQENTGRLPDNLGDIGIEETMEGPIYYQKIDSTNYVLWFGTTLGESVTYYSDKGTWVDF